MILKTAKVISHKIKIKFTCPVNEIEVVQEINKPRIGQSEYYEDWRYTYVDVNKCDSCGESHSFEI